MQVSRLTFPQNDPITIEEARAYLRKDGTSEDGVIRLAMKASADFVQAQTNRVVAPAQFRATAYDWPDRAPRFCLPLRPVRGVVAVTYLDVAGAEVPTTEFEAELIGGRGEVWFRPAFTFPALYNFEGARVFVDFDAGYDPLGDGTGTGDDPELALPATAKIVLLMLTEHWYQNRGVAGASDLKPFETATNALLDQLRIFN